MPPRPVHHTSRLCASSSDDHVRRRNSEVSLKASILLFGGLFLIFENKSMVLLFFKGWDVFCYLMGEGEASSWVQGVANVSGYALLSDVNKQLFIHRDAGSGSY